MKIDVERINRFLDQIASESADVLSVLEKKPDADIVRHPHIIKSFKYSVIVIAKAHEKGMLLIKPTKRYDRGFWSYSEHRIYQSGKRTFVLLRIFIVVLRCALHPLSAQIPT